MSKRLDLGKIGEQRAKKILEAKNYKVLASNWRSKHLEIDLICQFQDLIVFVEVKTRKSETFGLPEESVDKEKIKNLARAAEIYLETIDNNEQEIRFDIVSVLINENEEKIHHIEDAFFPGFMD